MIYKNREEREYAESIMNRIKDETFINVEPGNYGKCRVEISELFVQQIGPEAEDVMCFTALYLYGMGNFSRYAQFAFETCLGEEIKFRVYRDDDNKVARFFLPEEDVA